MNLINKTRNLSHKIWDTKSPKTIFVHVPKCGGSSIYEAISKSLHLEYPDGHLDPVWSRNLIGELYKIPEPEISSELQIFRHALMAKHVKDKKQFIAGHFTINTRLIEKVKTDYKVVTLLRSPDKRLFSHFKYWMLTRDLAKDSETVKNCWKTYVNSDRAKFQSNLFSIYFGESDFRNVNSSNVEQALFNLKQLDVIGDLENIDVFEDNISKMLDKKTTIGFANTSKKLINNDDLNSVFNQLFTENHELINDMVKMDTIIYKSFFNK